MEVKRLKITNVEAIEDDVSYVYDIHMNDTPHTFFANNILVHNTDSCFFKQSSGWQKHHEKWEGWFAKVLVEDFVSRYNNGCTPEYQMMELEYEKDLERIYFGDSKKRYYGIERNTGKKYIRGLNIIRADAPPFLKDKMNEITEKLVRRELTLEDITSLRQKIEEVPYKDLAITKKFSKPFEAYTKNKPQHVKGAKLANELLGTNIDHRDTPYLFYIVPHFQSGMKKVDQDKAICLRDEDLHFIDERKDLFEIDYEVYFEKQVLQQLSEFDHIDYLKDVLKGYKDWRNNNE